MLYYIFVIAVLNLGVGFAVAGCLGRRYRAIMGEDEFLGLPPQTDGTETDVPKEDVATETSDEEASSPAEDSLPKEDETKAVEESIADQPLKEAEPSEDVVAQPATPVEQPKRPDVQPMSFDGDLPDCLPPTDAAELEESLAFLMEATEEYLEAEGAKFRTSEEVAETPRDDDPLVDDSPADEAAKEPVPVAVEDGPADESPE